MTWFIYKINTCVLYNLCYFKASVLSKNTGKRIGIEDESNKHLMHINLVSVSVANTGISRCDEKE